MQYGLLKVYPHAKASFGSKSEYTHINGISYIYDWDSGIAGKYSEDYSYEEYEKNEEVEILNKTVKISFIAIYGAPDTWE